LPLDLRPKKTRAIRRRLTKHQVSLHLCWTIVLYMKHKSIEKVIHYRCVLVRIHNQVG
jgi:hypothetical protein